MDEATSMRLALAQVNPTVGDIEGNLELISTQLERARDAGAEILLAPELCLSGYPPEDLLLRGDFLDVVREALAELAARVDGIVALVGFPERVERPADERVNPIIDPLPPLAHNSLAVL